MECVENKGIKYGEEVAVLESRGGGEPRIPLGDWGLGRFASPRYFRRFGEQTDSCWASPSHPKKHPGNI